MGTETEDYLIDLLVDFDEMSFSPGTTCPNPDEYAREWKSKLIYAIGQLCKEKTEKFAEKLKEMHDYDEIICIMADKIAKEITEGE